MGLKKILTILLVVILAAPLLRSQEDPAPPNPEMQRQEIINLERETVRAVQLKNGTFFSRVYADDFKGVLSHGESVDKSQFINLIQSNGAVRYQSVNVSDISVHVFQQMAVATSLWSMRGMYKGQRVDTQIRVMHIYLNTSRGWHVVAGQATPLPPYSDSPF